MKAWAGVDIGSSTTKVVLVDGRGSLLGSAILRSGVDYQASASQALATALDQAGLVQGQLEAVFACGYGRHNVDFAQDTRTEIACHAAGAFFHFHRAMIVVDIGGQDNKVIKLDNEGRRLSFRMNRKCAAGTGAFLEEMALRLNLDLGSLDGLARKATSEASLGSFCTVFTATEVLARIREGVPVESLIKGLFRSVLKRVSEMETLTGVVVLTGGVIAHNPYLAEMLAHQEEVEVLVPPHPQLVGAWGAALLAGRLNGRPEGDAG